MQVSDQFIHQLKDQLVQNSSILLQQPESHSIPLDSQHPKLSKKQDFKDLLEKYEANRSKYQSVLQKSICLNSSRFAKTENDQDYNFDNGEDITFNNSSEDDLEMSREEIKNISIKEILEERNKSTFKKRIDLSISQKNDMLRTLPATETTINEKRLADSGNQFFKRKTVSSNYRFPDRTINGWIKSANKKKNMEDSNNVSGGSEETKIVSKRRYKDVDTLQKTREIKGEWSSNKFITKNNDIKYIEEEERRVKLLRLESQNEMIELKEHNKTLEQSIKKIKAQLKAVINKYNKSQDVRQFLSSSVQFQRTSYATLLGHHNNQIQLLNKQIKQLEEVKNNTKQFCLLQAKQIQQIANQNKQLKEQIKLSNTILQETTQEMTNQANTYASKIQMFESQMDQLNNNLKQAKKQLQQRSMQASQNIELLTELKSAENIIQILKGKYQQLQEYVKMINSANNPDPENLIETYIKQIFMKYQKASQQSAHMKNTMMKCETDIRANQRIMNQLKLQLQYKQCSINQIRIEQQQNQNKLRATQKMLQLVNDSLINKQMELGNYKYESNDAIEELKEQNESLRDQMSRIIQKLDLFENKIDNREFESDESSDVDLDLDMDESSEDGRFSGRRKGVTKKLRFQKVKKEDLSFIQVV